MSTITDRVNRLISEQFGVSVEECNNEMTFEQLEADSLDMVELLMEIEEEFELEIADDDADGFKTVGHVIAYLERYAPEKD